MPLIECRCHHCHWDEEFLLKIGEPNPPCSKCGQRTERLISMCGVVTDSTFMAGVGSLRDQLGDIHVPAMEGLMGAKGHRPVGSEMYCPGLARFPMDPQALVTSRHEVKKIARKRNIRVEGAVNHKPVTNHSQKPPVRLAPGIVERFRQEYIAKDSSLARANQAELRQQIIETHGSKE